uniref:hypothetical protein n=1 Tax=Agathobacter sp. TaxID=2021311 RepID=UPI004055A213
MINRERVKQLYKIAIYEQNEEKQHEAVGQYYKSDFIGKEILKSIFSGTITYGLMVAVWGICNITKVEEMLLDFEILEAALKIGLMYVGFMAIYLFATALIYNVRYEKGRKKLETYIKDLKAVEKMYERDEKLKM